MGRQTAIELFRENMGDMGQVGPVSLFLENSASMLDPALDGHNPDAANSYAKIQTAKAAQAARDVHDGTISGSVEGVRGGIAERVADNRESKAQKSERESRRADETAFFRKRPFIALVELV